MASHAAEVAETVDGDAALVKLAAQRGDADIVDEYIAKGFKPDSVLTISILEWIEIGAHAHTAHHHTHAARATRVRARADGSRASRRSTSESESEEEAEAEERSLRKSWLAEWKSCVRAGGLHRLSPSAKHHLAERIIRGSYKGTDGSHARYPSTIAHPPLLYPVVWDLLKPFLKAELSNSDVNMVGSHGRTLLHFAAESGTFEIVWLLLRYGASPSMRIKDADGRTPAQIAAIREEMYIADFLTKEAEDEDAANGGAKGSP
jgi:hypothetical protein